MTERATTYAELKDAISQAYPSLSPQRVAGHSDIAPGRKTDPGPDFDWSRLRALLQLTRG